MSEPTGGAGDQAADTSPKKTGGRRATEAATAAAGPAAGGKPRAAAKTTARNNAKAPVKAPAKAAGKNTAKSAAKSPGKTAAKTAARRTPEEPAVTAADVRSAALGAAHPPLSVPITGADVVRIAGVSRATVSYAMNDTADARIPEETRRRVRDIARELGYEPRSDARSLRRGRTDLIVLPTYTIPFGRLLTDFVDGLARELHKLGHTLITYGDPDANPVAAARSWAALRPAAVIVMPARLTPESTGYLTARGISVVALGWGTDELPGTSLVLVGETDRAGFVAAEHFIASGRRDIAVIVPYEEHASGAGLAALGRGRLAGVEEAVAAAPHPVRVRVVEMAETPADAARVVASWPPGDRPDAVFGYNDEYGALLLGALHDAGIRVPDEIALVGTDDLPLCEMVRPRLTSVGFTFSVPMARIAQRIADAVKEAPRTDGERLTIWHPTFRGRDSA
ncbi:LacI family DNA-binding transcriptional regulator [Yinghuangia soli]|uniref:LacI family transcriptional regulator n=1 Tax=Yinghuangia soli TaxID=2908204 RepID=A0AA41PXG3_9ACTN|nr:LacI family DNA-binding transcriptional regulator [Yinghuangia soli]MCF2527680.1 LacI family transcriptional regulator [Yinghuangia soli]